MEHTKGEWKVIFIDRNTTGIMIPFGSYYPESQQIADAYLKAAAPQLYEACFEAMACISSRTLIDQGMLDIKTLSLLREALIKAKPSIEQVEIDRNNNLQPPQETGIPESDVELDRKIE